MTQQEEGQQNHEPSSTFSSRIQQPTAATEVPNAGGSMMGHENNDGGGYRQQHGGRHHHHHHHHNHNHYRNNSISSAAAVDDAAAAAASEDDDADAASLVALHDARPILPKAAFFLGDLRDGIPMLNMQAAFLISAKSFTEKQVGVLFLVFGLSQFLCMAPAGYFLDYSNKKINWVIWAGAVCSALTVTTAVTAEDGGRNMGLMVFLKAVQGGVTAILPPGFNGITLGIVGSTGFTHQVSRNRMMNHIGTALVVALGSLIAYFLYPNIGALFVVSPLAAYGVYHNLQKIVPTHVNRDAARGLIIESPTMNEYELADDVAAAKQQAAVAASASWNGGGVGGPRGGGGVGGGGAAAVAGGDARDDGVHLEEGSSASSSDTPDNSNVRKASAVSSVPSAVCGSSSAAAAAAAASSSSYVAPTPPPSELTATHTRRCYSIGSRSSSAGGNVGAGYGSVGGGSRNGSGRNGDNGGSRQEQPGRASSSSYQPPDLLSDGLQPPSSSATATATAREGDGAGTSSAPVASAATTSPARRSSGSLTPPQHPNRRRTKAMNNNDDGGPSGGRAERRQSTSSSLTDNDDEDDEDEDLMMGPVRKGSSYSSKKSFGSMPSFNFGWTRRCSDMVDRHSRCGRSAAEAVAANDDGGDPQPPPSLPLPLHQKLKASTPLAVLLEPNLLIFTAVIFFFHLANSSVLPLVMQSLALRDPQAGILLSGLCILIAQGFMSFFAKVCGDYSPVWGRKNLMLIGLASLTVRCFLLTVLVHTEDTADLTEHENHVLKALVLSTQFLDSVGAGILGTLQILVTSDLSGGTGRFSLLLGFNTAAMCLGATVSGYVGQAVAADYGYPFAFTALGCMSLVPLATYVLFMPETLPDYARPLPPKKRRRRLRELWKRLMEHRRRLQQQSKKYNPFLRRKRRLQRQQFDDDKTERLAASSSGAAAAAGGVVAGAAADATDAAAPGSSSSQPPPATIVTAAPSGPVRQQQQQQQQQRRQQTSLPPVQAGDVELV